MTISKSTSFRILVIVTPLLLVGGGLAAAYSLPRNVWEAVGIAPKKVDNELPPCCQARGIAAKDAATEFAITNETTPAIAADESGRVFVAWSQPAEKNEWTLFVAGSLDGGAKFDPPRPVTTTGSPTNLRLSVSNDKLQLLWEQEVDEKGGRTTMEVESTNGGLSFSSPAPGGAVPGLVFYPVPDEELCVVIDGVSCTASDGTSHKAWEEEVPSSEAEASADAKTRIIMYSTCPEDGPCGEKKGVRPRVNATQKFPAIAVAKEGAVVAFCEINGDKAKIVVSQVK